MLPIQRHEATSRHYKITCSLDSPILEFKLTSSRKKYDQFMLVLVDDTIPSQIIPLCSSIESLFQFIVHRAKICRVKPPSTIVFGEISNLRVNQITFTLEKIPVNVEQAQKFQKQYQTDFIKNLVQKIKNLHDRCHYQENELKNTRKENQTLKETLKMHLKTQSKQIMRSNDLMSSTAMDEQPSTVKSLRLMNGVQNHQMTQIRVQEVDFQEQTTYKRQIPERNANKFELKNENVESELEQLKSTIKKIANILEIPVASSSKSKYSERDDNQMKANPLEKFKEGEGYELPKIFEFDFKAHPKCKYIDRYSFVDQKIIKIRNTEAYQLFSSKKLPPVCSLHIRLLESKYNDIKIGITTSINFESQSSEEAEQCIYYDGYAGSIFNEGQQIELDCKAKAKCLIRMRFDLSQRLLSWNLNKREIGRATISEKMAGESIYVYLELFNKGDVITFE